jgi:polygalacturonase
MLLKTGGNSMDNFFNIKSYGAKGDGITKDTKSIGKAIDACSRAGGGTVYFPPGVYHSGTICLKDNITIYLEAGATLFSSIDKEDFIFTEAPVNIPLKSTRCGFIYG